MPNLSEGLTALLSAIVRGAGRDSEVELRQRGGRSYHNDSRLPAAKVDRTILPPLVINVLESSPSPWTIACAQFAGSTPTGAAVVAVRREFPRKYTGVRWIFPHDEVAAWFASFPVPPTASIVALPSVAAVFALSEPVSVETASELSRLLAERTGGEPADDVPMPGTCAMNGYNRVARVDDLDATRVYEPAAFKTAATRRK